MSSACLRFKLHSAEKANTLLIAPLVHLPAVGRLTLLFVLLTHWQTPFLCHSELIVMLERFCDDLRVDPVSALLKPFFFLSFISFHFFSISFIFFHFKFEIS